MAYAKPSPLKKGVYSVLKEKSFHQCVRFSSEGACLNEAITKYKKGHYINSTRGFYDSDLKDWTVGFELFGQNRAFKQDEVKFFEKTTCQSLKKVYQTQLSVLDKSCQSNKDCKLANLRYNSCGGDLSFSKTVPQHYFDFVSKKRDQVRKLCKYVHPPCAHLNRYAKCEAGVCKAIEGMDPSSRKDFAIPSRNKQQSPKK